MLFSSSAPFLLFDSSSSFDELKLSLFLPLLLCLPFFFFSEGRRAVFLFSIFARQERERERDVGRDCSAKSAAERERKLLMNECQSLGSARRS